MGLIERIIVAIICVWLIVAFLLPFLFSIVAFPEVLQQLFKILVVLGGIWYVWKGRIG